jgi:hypothetical protein
VIVGVDGLVPGDVQLLVLVAPMIPSPGESPGAWWSNTGETTARRRLDERVHRLETYRLQHAPPAP